MKMQRPSEIGTVGWISTSPWRVTRSVTKHFSQVVPIAGVERLDVHAERVGVRRCRTATSSGSSPGRGEQVDRRLDLDGQPE